MTKDDGFHIDFEPSAVKKKIGESLQEEIDKEKALAATAVDLEKLVVPPLMCRVLRAEYGRAHEFKVPVYGTGGHESIQCETVLHTDDPTTKHVVFPYHVNIRGDDWIRATIVPVQKMWLKWVQDKDAKHVVVNPKERGMLRTSHVYIPRAPAETELAVLLERMDEQSAVKETYHGASLQQLLAPRSYPGFGSSRDMVFKKS